jgi:hypothetical protein
VTVFDEADTQCNDYSLLPVWVDPIEFTLPSPNSKLMLGAYKWFDSGCVRVMIGCFGQDGDTIIERLNHHLGGQDGEECHELYNALGLSSHYGVSLLGRLLFNLAASVTGDPTAPVLELAGILPGEKKALAALGFDSNLRPLETARILIAMSSVSVEATHFVRKRLRQGGLSASSLRRVPIGDACNLLANLSFPSYVSALADPDLVRFFSSDGLCEDDTRWNLGYLSKRGESVVFDALMQGGSTLLNGYYALACEGRKLVWKDAIGDATRLVQLS